MPLLANERTVGTLANVIAPINVAKLKKLLVFGGFRIVIRHCNDVIVFYFRNSCQFNIIKKHVRVLIFHLFTAKTVNFRDAYIYNNTKK